MAQNKSLMAALVQAQKAINPVAKDAENAYHHYSYASAESIMREARKALNEAGLAISMGSTRIDYSVNPPLLVCEFVLYHGDSGETRLDERVWPIIVSKGREMDKAVAAADTSCQSYYLRDLLQIPRISEEDEMDSRVDNEPIQPRRKEQPKTETKKFTGVMSEIQGLIDLTGTNIVDFLNYFNVSSLSALDEQQAKLAKVMLTKKLEEQANAHTGPDTA